MKIAAASNSKTLCETLSLKTLALAVTLVVTVAFSQSAAFGACTLNGNPVPCVLTGPVTINTYTDGPGNITTSSGALTDNGTMSIQGGLELVAATSLLGPGVLTLINGQIGTNSVNYTLTNASNIDGYGVIGSNGLTYPDLSLDNSSTIDADSTGNTLSIQGTGGSIINSGTFEATNGGILTLVTSAAINNNGGLITASGTNSVVNVSTTIEGGTFSTSAGGVVQTSGGATLDALSQGAITLTDGSTYTAGPTGSSIATKITGTLNLGTVSGSTMSLGGALELIGNTTVNTPGSGSITMNNGQIGTNSVNYTLSNAGLIQGWGLIGSNATTYQDLSLNNTGTINANSSGNILSIQGTGSSILNAGTFEATNGGTLNIGSLAVAVNNQNGVILAGNGSTVDITTITVEGGTLTTQGTGVMQTNGGATLDASTLGAITLSDGSTYTAGPAGTSITTKVAGTLNLGTVSGSTLALGGALELIGDTTVNTPGSGSIVMTHAQIGTNSVNYTLTNPGLIQGWGVIGSNATTYQDLSLNNTGTINANSSGNILSIQGTGSSIINAGLFEATSGATLNLGTSAAINNQNGVIKAGNGSTVTIVNTTIEGGKLTTQGTGLMQTVGTVTLDANSLGAITLTDGSTYVAGDGTATALTNVTGQLTLGTTTGSTLQVTTVASNLGYFRLVGDTTLSGPGSLVLNGGLVGTNSVNYTLTNTTLIQGYGEIGSNVGADYQDLNLNNSGTINANSNGNTLTIDGTGSSLVNAGLFEATNGSTMHLATSNPINNSGGNITATGAGSTVNVSTTIQGGTLNTSSGGVMQTSGGATLDGISHGAITLSDGSTYMAGNGPLTKITGTLNLGTSTGGTLTLSGQMQLIGNTDFSGPGTVVMSGNAQIGTNSVAYTLTNDSNIQGSGLIGSNIGALFGNNNLTNNGVILSNGGTMTLGGTGTLTNTGTLHATAGTTLVSSMSGLSASTYASNTLLTGTYIADAGATIQINKLGTTGGEIVNNAATIVLNGVGSAFLDGGSKDALSNFNNNMAAGSFTIQNGRNFSSPGVFSNAGAVNIGSGSTFSTASGSYNQSGGSTKVDGALAPAAGQVSFAGGTLLGNGGTITGNVSMSGTISPGDTPAAAGALGIAGNYAQLAAGIFQLDLGGLTAGSQFDVLNITGTTSLSGTLDVSLIGTYFPNVGDTFTFITSGGLVSGIFGTVNGLNIGGGEVLQVVYNSNNVQISTLSLAPVNDYWNGGTGVWSNGGQWSLGTSPGSNNNAFIYSGGNDVVTLDIGSGTVNQLNVGGATNGFTSELSDNATAQNLTIIQGLNIGANGLLYLAGGSTVTAATMSNSGQVYIGTLATLNLTSQPGGITDVPANASFTVLGSFNAGANSGFVNLTSVEGSVELGNGQTTNITPNGGSLTVTADGIHTFSCVTYGLGCLDVSNASTLNVNGNLNNNGPGGSGGLVSTGRLGTGGNTLAITGNVNNSSNFELLGSGDQATMAGLTNSGFVDVEHGSTLQVTGNVNNSLDLGTGHFGLGGNTLDVTGGLTNSAGSYFFVASSGDIANVGTLTNSGSAYVGPGATMNLTGQPGGVTDVPVNASFNILGSFKAGVNSGFVNLTSVEGAVDLGNGQTTNITPNGGTLSVTADGIHTFSCVTYGNGCLDVSNASTLNINGNLDVIYNGGSGAVVSTGRISGGGDTLSITGNLNNGSYFELLGSGDKATMAGLTNSGYVDVEGGSTFQVNGNVSNSGQIYTSFNGTGGNTFKVTGNLTNTNFIGLESTDTATIGGTVNNSGSFQLTGGADATFTSALTNSGTLDLENASTLKVNSTVNNTGTFSTSANGGTGGNMVTVTGLLTNQAGGQLTLNGPSDVLKASGGLTNNGTVSVNNGSTIDPPFVNNLGNINIDGTSTFVVGTGSTSGTGFIQLPNGTFGEIINSATAFGQVNVAGSGLLDGTLDIMLMSGYNPAVGQSFTFLLTNPGQLSGTYSNILGLVFNGGTEKWLVSYNYAGGYAQLTAAANTSPVPEPGTFFLLGSGLLGLSYSARRRWRK